MRTLDKKKREAGGGTWGWGERGEGGGGADPSPVFAPPCNPVTVKPVFDRPCGAALARSFKMMSNSQARTAARSFVSRRGTGRRWEGLGGGYVGRGGTSGGGGGPVREDPVLTAAPWEP